MYVYIYICIYVYIYIYICMYRERGRERHTAVAITQATVDPFQRLLESPSCSSDYIINMYWAQSTRSRIRHWH